jgi:hypothetical protein
MYQFAVEIPNGRKIYHNFLLKGVQNDKIIKIFNMKYTIWGTYLTSPLGANFGLKCEVVPHGWILSPGWSYPLGVKFSVRPYVHSWVFTTGVERRGEHSTYGNHFTPGGQVHPLGPGVKLKMALKIVGSKPNSTLISFIKIVFDLMHMRRQK